MPQHASKSGVSLAENGLILACVVCVSIAGLQSLGSQISGQFNFITDEIGKVSGTLGNNSSSSGPPSSPDVPSSPGIPETPPSPPETNPDSNIEINGTGSMSPYPNNGIAGSVAGVDKNNPPGGKPGPKSQKVTPASASSTPTKKQSQTTP